MITQSLSNVSFEAFQDRFLRKHPPVVCMLVLLSKSAVGNSWNCFKCPFPRFPCTTAIVTQTYSCSACNNLTILRAALYIQSASLPSELIKVKLRGGRTQVWIFDLRGPFASVKGSCVGLMGSPPEYTWLEKTCRCIVGLRCFHDQLLRSVCSLALPADWSPFYTTSCRNASEMGLPLGLVYFLENTLCRHASEDSVIF